MKKLSPPDPARLPFPSNLAAFGVLALAAALAPAPSFAQESLGDLEEILVTGPRRERGLDLGASMRNLTWRQIAVLLGCVLTLATLAVGIYGLVRGPQSADSTPAPPPPGESGAIPEEATPVVTLKDRALPHTSDPIAYSRAVASSLFDWDASLGFLPTDYTAAVLADADPSGEETPGLIADVATYLPTVDQ